MTVTMKKKMILRPVSLAVLVLASSLSFSAAADDARRSYIVQLVDKPAATYDGKVSGYTATKPAAGQRLNVDATAVQNYISYLDQRQGDVLNAVAGAPVTHQFKVVFNGFAAQLTDAEVRALKKHAGVMNITADSILIPNTVSTPAFVGLTQAGGLWQQLGGQDKAGENIIVGIIDSGIWPEHPSFADRVDSNGLPSHSGSTVVYDAPPASWKGSCVTGEGFALSNCNNKLIGARYFKEPAQSLHWTEFLSPRDSVAGPTGHGGHGTHVASTAAGNANVKVVQGGFELGSMSGIAPRARIAAYKVCWTDIASGRNGCATSNSVAAVEQAVKDGVNVINFSIGPSAGGGSFSEATEVAFLGAASAGVFVSTSAGNAGPTSTTPAPTAHISPWLTSVANSTHDRLFVGTIRLGNGTDLTGASSNAKLPSTPLILAKDAGLPGVNPTDTNLLRCFGDTDTVAPLLDPAKVTGKILVCDRGSNVLVNKSANAKAAGAAGMIIANTPTSAATILNAPHTLPTVHIKAAETAVLKAYIASVPASATASFLDVRAIRDLTVSAPVINSGSSRGPNVANPNILKPDISAPGTDILAAVTADLTQEERNLVANGAPSTKMDYEFYSGTSMASPHIAGMAALLKQLHPDWTPAAIKSALMTTATPTKPDGLNGSMPWDTTARNSGILPWAQGAGQAVPSAAAKPGLVYDATEIDYARFLCGLNAQVYSPATCTQIGTIPAYNLNLASLTAANVLGSLTLTRTVTNVSGAAATYTSAASLDGFAVQVTPATFTLAAGAKQTFQVKLTRTTAPINTWTYGQLVWSDGAGTTVRSPLQARGSTLSAPATVVSEATTGSKVITIGTGFAGAMTAVKSGLLPAARDTRTVGSAGTDSDVYVALCKAGGGPGVSVHSVSVPAGTMLARFALYDEDTAGGSASDLDLVVTNSAGVTVGSSGTGGSNERVQMVNPAADTYNVCVIGYDPVGGSAQYTLSSWLLQPNVINGNFKAILPAYSYLGGTGSVSLSWSGLAANTRHLGMLRYQVGGATYGNTIVEVETDDPLPKFDTNRVAPANSR